MILFASPHDGFRLVRKKARGANVLLEFLWVGIREGIRLWILRKQRRGDDVHAFVGALGRENRRDEQLKGVLVPQRAGDRRIRLVESLEDRPDARGTSSLRGGLRSIDAGGFPRSHRHGA